ncbi:MAG TPA: cation transporter [Acidimicrobiales bacterium]|nr:cation transporter [Acidimicrobiales bacterium]
MTRPHSIAVADHSSDPDVMLRSRALRLEWGTNAWNAMEVFVTVGLGVAAGSLALVAFGLDSLVELFASMVVIWHLRGPGGDSDGSRTFRALRLIAGAFWVLCAYLLVAGVRSLWLHEIPGHSPVGIAYLGITACVMFALAHAKKRIARSLRSGPLDHEASMTYLDSGLSIGILAALAASMGLGWWWADAVAAIAVAVLAGVQGAGSWRDSHPVSGPPR